MRTASSRETLGITKPYRVVVKHVEMREYIIEATSRDEARMIPEPTDDESEWEYREDSSFEIVAVEELDG